MSKIRSNRLSLARKRLGYEQKQVVKLLGYKATPPFSRYETGQKIPSLRVALKLSILYRLPIRVLFGTYYDECRRELNNRYERFNKESRRSIDLTEPTGYCSYIELINSLFMTDVDKAKVRRHAKELMDERRRKILGH